MNRSSTSAESHSWAPGILVLGMHRSGTSCLAGMLQCIGFRTGAVDVWNLHNERGNRENSAVMGLNDALLACSGGTWDKPPLGLEHNAFHGIRAEQVLVDMDARAKPWMFKDPRTLLTFSFWRHVVPEALQIGIFRHPEAVVRSLQQRNELATAHALELWCIYNERLCAAHEQRPFPLLHFSNADGDFGERARRAIDAMLEAFPDQDGFEMAGLEAFFSPDLIHNQPGLSKRLPAFGDVDDALQARAQALWVDLLERQNPAADSLLAAEYPVDLEDGDAADHDPIGDLRDALSGSDALPTATSGRLEDLLDVAHQQGRYPELDDLLQDWLDRSAGHPLLHFTLAKSAHAQGHEEAAASHAAAAHNAAPGWVQPLEALARWSAGQGRLIQSAQATTDLQRLVRGARNHTALFAQLFVDGGNGFSEVGSLKLPYQLGEARVRLSFESGLISDRPVALRFDPLEEHLVLDQLVCQAVTDEGEAVVLTPVSNNALYEEEGRYYFNTGDPQLHFDLAAVENRTVHFVTIEFDVIELGSSALEALARLLDGRGRALTASLEKSEYAKAAFESAVASLRQELAALEARYAALKTIHEDLDASHGELQNLFAHQLRWSESLVQDVRATDETLEIIGNSFSGRLGAAASRIFMSPLTLGFGDTSLDELSRRRMKLRDTLEERPGGAESEAGDQEKA